MKKLALVVMLIIPSVLFAGSDYTKRAQLIFDLRAGHGNYYFDAGFSEEAEAVSPSYTPVRTDEISFDVSDGVYEGVGIYWVIKGGAGLVMKLYADGPMVMGDEELEWQILCNSQQLGGGNYGNRNSGVVYDRSNVTSVIDAGYITLGIEALPENMQRAGSYAASLVLEIESSN